MSLDTHLSEALAVDDVLMRVLLAHCFEKGLGHQLGVKLLNHFLGPLRAD